MLAALFAAGMAPTVASKAAVAAGYPDKPIKFVAHSAAGSPLDTMMRQLAKQLSEVTHQDVAVENRVGGSGAVAMAYTMARPADGYTVLSATGSTSFTMAGGRIPFKPEDFIVVRALQAEPTAVAVRKDSKLKTLADFVQALRDKPNGLKVGGFATGGFHQFVFYRLQEAANIKASWIPFGGGNEAALALLGGHIDVAMMTPSSALAQVQSGEFRLLAISTDGRDDYFPDVPTFKEQGYDIVEAIWRGVMLKKGTPAAIVEALGAAIDKVQATDEWKKFMRANLQSRLERNSAQMQEQMRREVASRQAFLRANGLLK